MVGRIGWLGGPAEVHHDLVWGCLRRQQVRLQGAGRQSSCWPRYGEGPTTARQVTMQDGFVINFGSTTFQAHLSAPPLRSLYHYTTPAGLLGITKSVSIWAARPQDLNDETEQKIAWQIAKAELDRLLEEETAPDRREFLGAMRNARPDGSAIFTASFSAEGDSLEQWRAYFPRSGGVALALPGDHLRDVAAEQGWSFGPCIYEHDEQVKIVQETILATLSRTDQNTPENITARVLREFAQEISALAPYIKHEAFKLENEWRVAVIWGESKFAGYEFVAVPTGLRQFLPFSLVTPNRRIVETSSEHPQASAGLMVGPNVDKVAMGKAAIGTFPWQFGTRRWLGYTSTPYR